MKVASSPKAAVYPELSYSHSGNTSKPLFVDNRKESKNLTQLQAMIYEGSQYRTGHHLAQFASQANSRPGLHNEDNLKTNEPIVQLSSSSEEDYLPPELDNKRRINKQMEQKNKKKQKLRDERKDNGDDDPYDDDFSAEEGTYDVPSGYKPITAWADDDYRSAEKRVDLGHNDIYAMKKEGRNWAVWFYPDYVQESDEWSDYKGDTKDGNTTWHHTAVKGKQGWIMQRVDTRTHQKSCPHIGAVAIEKSKLKGKGKGTRKNK